MERLRGSITVNLNGSAAAQNPTSTCCRSATKNGNTVEATGARIAASFTTGRYRETATFAKFAPIDPHLKSRCFAIGAKRAGRLRALRGTPWGCHRSSTSAVLRAAPQRKRRVTMKAHAKRGASSPSHFCSSKQAKRSPSKPAFQSTCQS